jgi:hypothetical protein
MTKIKVTGITVALLGLLCAAFKSAQNPPCWYNQQYYLVGGTYVPAGILGETYICWESTNTCTYYRPNPVTQPNVYVACQDGTYTSIP